MSGEAIRVSGLKELIKNARAVDKTLPAEIREINKAAAESIVPTAKSLVPVDSGLLRSSIRSGATTKAGTIKAGRSTLPYAGVIHFGFPARGIDAQPFLYAALDARRKDVQDQYEKAIDAFTRRAL